MDRMKGKDEGGRRKDESAAVNNLLFTSSFILPPSSLLSFLSILVNYSSPHRPTSVAPRTRCCRGPQPPRRKENSGRRGRSGTLCGEPTARRGNRAGRRAAGRASVSVVFE